MHFSHLLASFMTVTLVIVFYQWVDFCMLLLHRFFPEKAEILAFDMLNGLLEVSVILLKIFL